ncbi:MAG: hypothetical protein HXS48_28030 [Theionarchaea archaeon]|nr:hypothetical protein [Theionarchaea archaeon]
MRTMGEIMGKIGTMKRNNMSLWLKENELQFDTIEKDLKEFAHWLLQEE